MSSQKRPARACDVLIGSWGALSVSRSEREAGERERIALGDFRAPFDPLGRGEAGVFGGEAADLVVAHGGRARLFRPRVRETEVPVFRLAGEGLVDRAVVLLRFNERVVERQAELLLLLVHQQVDAAGVDVGGLRTVRVARLVRLIEVEADQRVAVAAFDEDLLVAETGLHRAGVEQRARVAQEFLVEQVLHRVAGLRRDLEVQPQAEAGERERDGEHRRGQAPEADARDPEAGELVFRRHPAEHQQQRGKEAPRDGEDQRERQHVEQEAADQAQRRALFDE